MFIFSKNLTTRGQLYAKVCLPGKPNGKIDQIMTVFSAHRHLNKIKALGSLTSGLIMPELSKVSFNPQTPVALKIADEVVFDVCKVKESSFLNRTSLTPPQIFDPHLLENTDLSPSRFHFSVGFISRSFFESDGFIAYLNE